MLPQGLSVATEAAVFSVPGSNGKKPGLDLMPVTQTSAGHTGFPERMFQQPLCLCCISFPSSPTLLVENQLHSFVYIMNNVGGL